MITVIDPEKISNPETIAMLMAFYSRSTIPIQERLSSLGETESNIKESLKKYYLGYGHASIGDCGDASIFIENISMLAAKALESFPLFNGQETSSRYINFEKQHIHDPLNTKESADILNCWMDLYKDMQIPVYNLLTEQFPIQSSQNLTTYHNALSARCFDITRAFLPAGISTQVGMKMSFRALNDALLKLDYHPLEEVGNISKEILRKLIVQFPNTFNPRSFEINKINYLKNSIEKEFYLLNAPSFSQPLLIHDTVDNSLFDNEYPILKNRPKGILLPSYLNTYGTIKIRFSLDFGSWRDLQRHRNTLSNRCTPLFHTCTFNMMYLNSLDNYLKKKAINVISDQYDKLKYLRSFDKYLLQYYYPLGTLVNCEIMLTIPELFYILELRSSPSVHFTLRNLIHQIWNKLKPKYGIIDNYINEDETDFHYNRGNQTILEKV